jgi:hypothetical protein
MYMPNYNFSAPTKSMTGTQKVLNTIHEFRLFSILVTLAAVACDWSQMRYYVDITFNDSFWGGMCVSVIVVLCLDVSMFILGTVINQHKKTSGMAKDNFRFTVIGLISTFAGAYAVYLSMAIPVMIQQADNGDTPVLGRLIIPVVSSLISFFTSVGWNPRGDQLQHLKDEKMKIESDIASTENTIAKINRDFRQLDLMNYENVQAERAFDLLLSKVDEATNDARILLARELGTPEAADALLAKAGLNDDNFWELARKKITDSAQLFPAFDSAADGAPVKELPADSTPAEPLPVFPFSMTS